MFTVMMICEQMGALLPVCVLGLTVIFVLLSMTYNRNHSRHAVFTLIGLILSAFSSLTIFGKNQGLTDFCPLIYADKSTVLYIILIIIASVSSAISGYIWLSHYSTYRRDEFYLLLLISSMGGILLTISNHLIILFLGMELISVPLFGLITYAVFQKKSISSGIKYIILSGVSSSFFLFGIAFIYCDIGSLHFFDIKEMLFINHSQVGVVFNAQSPSMLLVVVGLIMMMVGIGFKLSLVPFHLWTLDIYQGAPTAVSMYLATVSKIAVIAAFIRFLLMFPEQYHKLFYIFLLVPACFSMLFGSLMAIQQSDIKRILACSSITHAGYVLMILIALRVNNYSIIQEAVGLYLISYVASNIGVFSIINFVSSLFYDAKEKQQDINIDFICRGLFWREPMLSIMYVVLILSLAGMPLTLGFISKFYVLLIGISSQLWLLIICMVISNIISLFYYLNIIADLFSYSNDLCVNRYCISSWYIRLNKLLLVAITIIIVFCGVYPQPVIYLAQHMI